MGGKGRKFSRQRNERKKRAIEAQTMLIQAMERHSGIDDELPNNVALQRWKIGQRHKVGIPESHRDMICRKCQSMLISSRSVRVRIRNGIRTSTCLKCGSIRRKIVGCNNE